MVVWECSQRKGGEVGGGGGGGSGGGGGGGGGQLKNTGDYTPLVETLGGWLTL